MALSLNVWAEESRKRRGRLQGGLLSDRILREAMDKYSTLKRRFEMFIKATLSRTVVLIMMMSAIVILCGRTDAGALDKIDMMGIVTQQHDRDVAAASAEKKASLQSLHDNAVSNCAIVSSINAPDHDTQGLAWDAGNLWLSEGEFASTYQGEIFDSNTSGNILYSFPAPGQSYPGLGLSAGEGVEGLAFDGTYLWSIDFLDHKIYRLNTSGAVIGSIPTPNSSYVASGLAWDGSNLWVSEWNQEIYKINPANGQVLSSFNAPDYGDQTNGLPYGLAWDGTHLWVSNNNGIHMIDPATGSVLASCNDSALYGNAYGLTWDGHYLWAGSWISNSVIKIDVSNVTGNMGSISSPSSQQSFSYPPVAYPVMNIDPSQAKPIGVGSVAESGDTLSVAVQLAAFSEPVDLYFGLYVPSLDPNNIYIVKQDNSFQTVAQGLVPWRKNVTTATSESLFGDIPVSSLPPGQYTLYLLATPAGSLNSYYLWSTSFDISNSAPRTFNLTLSTEGSGSGSVSSSPAEINDCSSTCSASFALGTSVTLTATPASGSAFAGWLVNGSNSVCPGTGNYCTISINADELVTATFNAVPPPSGTNYYLCAYSASVSNSCDCAPAFLFSPPVPGFSQTLVGNGQRCDGTNYICSAGLVCYENVDVEATGVCQPAGSESAYGCLE
jgi:glutamine cyclotransferase